MNGGSGYETEQTKKFLVEQEFSFPLLRKFLYSFSIPLPFNPLFFDRFSVVFVHYLNKYNMYVY